MAVRLLFFFFRGRDVTPDGDGSRKGAWRVFSPITVLPSRVQLNRKCPRVKLKEWARLLFFCFFFKIYFLFFFHLERLIEILAAGHTEFLSI